MHVLAPSFSTELFTPASTFVGLKNLREYQFPRPTASLKSVMRGPTDSDCSILKFSEAGMSELQSTRSWAAQLQRDLERAFDLNWRGVALAEGENKETFDWTPPVDIRETDQAYVLIADIPGVATEQLEITTDKGVLTIRGERSAQVPSAPDRYNRIERAHGTFLRRFTLPKTANADAIAAKSTNGVLTVTVPKLEVV